MQAAIQQICSKLVQREIVHCCSNMISELVGAGDKTPYQEELYALVQSKPDYEASCREAGWVTYTELSPFGKARARYQVSRIGPVTFAYMKRGSTTEVSTVRDWEALANDNRIEPYEREIYEHWIVTSWLAHKLAEKGETTGELFDFSIWGRCCTGQAISMDSVIIEIASDMEILPGQKYDWSEAL